MGISIAGTPKDSALIKWIHNRNMTVLLCCSVQDGCGGLLPPQPATVINVSRNSDCLTYQFSAFYCNRTDVRLLLSLEPNTSWHPRLPIQAVLGPWHCFQTKTSNGIMECFGVSLLYQIFRCLLSTFIRLSWELLGLSGTIHGPTTWSVWLMEKTMAVVFGKALVQQQAGY